MTYSDAYIFADALYSEMFEGIPQKIHWNKTQRFWINNTQVYGLVNPLTDEARKRYISKIYLSPMNDLITLSKQLDDPADILSKMGLYKLYSGHDF